MVKSTISKTTYEAIYRLLDRVSPVDYDCGTLCGGACCTCTYEPDDIEFTAEGDENADDETKWQGENRLGKVLDEVRAKLLAGYKEEIKY